MLSNHDSLHRRERRSGSSSQPSLSRAENSDLIAGGRRSSPAGALQYPLGFADIRPAGSLAEVIVRPQRRQLFRYRYVD
jgi:hypothetical protein